ncbi:MAG: cytochrome c3 family protein [Planctomycetota bacterium]|jgi:hypothetical protein
MRRAPLLFAVALAAPLIFCFSRDPRPAETDRPAAEADDPDTQSEDPDAETDDQPDSIWANAACYVCHTLFVKEELSKVHLNEKVTCIKCHGLSAAHANDENIGATPPDVAFRRDQIDPLCLRCHTTHDAPAREVLARFIQRRLSPKSPPTCTDCHGRHKIEQPADKQRA